MINERNIRLDVIRGAAAYMVVFTHIIQLYGDSSNNIVNNVFLALQMPLFMMVSGYTSKYSKPVVSTKQLFLQISKRSRLLLLPWLSWSLILYLVYKNDVPFLEHISNVAYHMEGAYWFLFSLWCIDVVFVIAQYLHNVLFLKKTKALGTLILFYLGVGVYAVVGYVFGFSFLGIKFTLYYQLFFMLGFLLSFVEIKTNNMFLELAMMIAAVFFFCVTCTSNVFELPETVYNTGTRVIVSAVGCILAYYYANKIEWNLNSRITKYLQWGGGKSLEIYVVHYLLLRVFLKVSPLAVNTVASMVQTIEYFVIILLMTYIIIEFFSLNPVTRLLLFGKQIKKGGGRTEH